MRRAMRKGLVIGVAVYWLYGRRHSVLAQRETATIK